MSPAIQSVFVSSTWLDLQPERQAVEEALHRMREFKFVGMEYFGSRDETTRQASLDEIDQSQIYIGIIGGRYGSGITIEEYRRARERGLACFIYFKDDKVVPHELRDTEPAKISRLNAFKDELIARHIITSFSSPDDLSAKVQADLHRWYFNNYQKTIVTGRKSVIGKRGRSFKIGIGALMVLLLGSGIWAVKGYFLLPPPTTVVTTNPAITPTPIVVPTASVRPRPASTSTPNPTPSPTPLPSLTPTPASQPPAPPTPMPTRPPLRPASILEFRAGPSSITAGENATLCYSVANAQNALIDSDIGPNIGAVDPTRGTCLPIRPTQTTIYTLAARGFDAQTVTKRLRVFVRQPAPSQPSPQPEILEFFAQQSIIIVGTQTSLCYSMKNVVRAGISPRVRPLGNMSKGCVPVMLTETTKFTLTALNPEGRSISRSLTVEVRRR